MSDARTRVAQIGAGFISTYHLQGLQSAGADVVMVCDNNQERARRQAALFHVPDFSADHRDSLKRGDIDAVIVATPDNTHESITIDALRAGKATLVQKPMASSSEACRRMLQVANDEGVLLCVSWMHRYFEEVLYLRELLSQGILGTVFSIRQRNAIRGADSDPWFYSKEAVGGGAVIQLGIHGIDLLRYLFGPIEAVLAHTALQKTRRVLKDGTEVIPDNEDLAYIIYRFASGARAIQEVVSHELAGTDRFRTEVYGEDGTAWLRTERGPLAIYLAEHMRSEGWFEPDLPDAVFGKRHHEHFLEMVQADQPPDTSAVDGLAATLTVEAIYRSAESGQWEEVVVP